MKIAKLKFIQAQTLFLALLFAGVNYAQEKVVLEADYQPARGVVLSWTYENIATPNNTTNIHRCQNTDPDTDCRPQDNPATENVDRIVDEANNIEGIHDFFLRVPQRDVFVGYPPIVAGNIYRYQVSNFPRGGTERIFSNIVTVRMSALTVHTRDLRVTRNEIRANFALEPPGELVRMDYQFFATPPELINGARDCQYEPDVRGPGGIIVGDETSSNLITGDFGNTSPLMDEFDTGPSTVASFSKLLAGEEVLCVLMHVLERPMLNGAPRIRQMVTIRARDVDIGAPARLKAQVMAASAAEVTVDWELDPPLPGAMAAISAVGKPSGEVCDPYDVTLASTAAETRAATSPITLTTGDAMLTAAQYDAGAVLCIRVTVEKNMNSIRPMLLQVRACDFVEVGCPAAEPEPFNPAADETILSNTLRNLERGIRGSIVARIEQRQYADGRWNRGGITARPSPAAEPATPTGPQEADTDTDADRSTIRQATAASRFDLARNYLRRARQYFKQAADAGHARAKSMLAALNGLPAAN